MIYKYQNVNGMSKSQEVVEGLGQVIAQEPQAVIIAIRNAGIILPMSSSIASITKTIKSNTSNKRLMQNLSAVVLLHKEYKQFYNKEGKTGFFKKIGNLFRKPVNEDGSRGQSNFGSWWQRNKSDANEVGGILARSIMPNQITIGGGALVESGNQGGRPSPTSNRGRSTLDLTDDDMNDKKKMSMQTKLAIGAGVLALIGVVVFVVRRKKK